MPEWIPVSDYRGRVTLHDAQNKNEYMCLQFDFSVDEVEPAEQWIYNKWWRISH